MTTCFLLGYLALLNGFYAYLLTGPVGMSFYLIGLITCLLASPIQRGMAHKMELAAFNRDVRIAEQTARLQMSYGGNW